MNKYIQWLIWVLFAPLVSLIIWIFKTHTWSNYIDILFIVSMLLFIAGFVVILVQDGVFDATSYGFRRIRYQMAGKKHQKAWKDDEFMNPKQAKKDFYLVEAWAKRITIINALFILLCLCAILTF